MAEVCGVSFGVVSAALGGTDLNCLGACLSGRVSGRGVWMAGQFLQLSMAVFGLSVIVGWVQTGCPLQYQRCCSCWLAWAFLGRRGGLNVRVGHFRVFRFRVTAWVSARLRPVVWVFRHLCNGGHSRPVPESREMLREDWFRKKYIRQCGSF